MICSDKTGTLTLNKMTVTHLALDQDFYNGTATPIKEVKQMHSTIYQELIYASASTQTMREKSLETQRRGLSSIWRKILG